MFINNKLITAFFYISKSFAWLHLYKWIISTASRHGVICNIRTTDVDRTTTYWNGRSRSTCNKASSTYKGRNVTSISRYGSYIYSTCRDRRTGTLYVIDCNGASIRKRRVSRSSKVLSICTGICYWNGNRSCIKVNSHYSGKLSNKSKLIHYIT